MATTLSAVELDHMKYFSESYQILQNNEILPPNFEYARFKTRAVENLVLNSPACAFQQLFSSKALDLVVSIINGHLQRRRQSPKIPKKNRSLYQDVSRKQLMHFIGGYILLGNTYSAETKKLREHWTFLREEFNISFGTNRLQLLFRTLVPTNQEMLTLISEIRNQAYATIVPSTIVAIDEALYAYYATADIRKIFEEAGDPIPQVYIERKPRKNGFLNYLLAVSFPNPTSPNQVLPFVLDMHPYLNQPAPKHYDVVRIFMHQWRYEHKPHFVMDNAFGSFELMDEIVKWGGSGTVSIPMHIEETLWKLMGMNLAQNQWRAAQHTSGMIITSSKIQTSSSSEATTKLVQKNLLATGYRSTTTSSSRNRTNPISDSEASHLLSLSLPTLRQIASRFGYSTEGSKYDLIQRLTGADLMQENRNVNAALSQNTSSTSSPPQLNLVVTRAQLEGLTLVQLRYICAEAQIKPGK